ncbi:MAG: hypothetical protein AAGC60_24540 [Acidobacteriota bacterium]
MPNVTREFVADPVAFIRENPVSSMSDTPLLTVENVALKRYDPRVVKGADNLVKLKAPEDDEASVQFYILGWRVQNVAVGQLGSQANYFYTGPMDGCTVGIDKNWARPTVTHINLQTNTGATDRPAMRQRVATTLAHCTSFWTGRVNVTIVESALNSERYKVNIFGVRGYLGWTFYRQEMDLGVFPYRVTAVETLSTSW